MFVPEHRLNHRHSPYGRSGQKEKTNPTLVGKWRIGSKIGFQRKKASKMDMAEKISDLLCHSNRQNKKLKLKICDVVNTINFNDLEVM